MSDVAIKIGNLGKRYRYGGAASVSYNLRQDLTDWARGLLRRPDHRPQTKDSSLQSPVSHPTLHEVQEKHLAEDPNYFWALRDINLEVRQGEVVGIIGRNGAGKSTLLKILSRITPPTTGKISYHGRMASLLEVGTGFHRELTGRENIFLNGSILGMKRSEIAKKFDEIVAFAEVEKFIDTPVKFYSSGMYVRLAFAVAAHLEPEILVVDEVLAVGDAGFQKKCLGKMGDVAKEGRTVLVVSHNMIAIQGLCTRAIWLNNGMVQSQGTVTEVIQNYQHNAISSCGEQIWPDLSTAPGNEDVRLSRVAVVPCEYSITGAITMQTPVKIEVEFWNYSHNAQLDVTLHLLNDQGVIAFSTSTVHRKETSGRLFSKGRHATTCYIPGDLLASGMSTVKIIIVRDQARAIYIHDDALAFEVVELERQHANYGKRPGVVAPRLNWDIRNCN